MADSSDRPPEVYGLGAMFESGSAQSMFSRIGWKLRGFGPNHCYSMLEEFTLARPRPALLIAQTCGYEGYGLDVAKKCREMEPGLKLIILSAHKKSTLDLLYKKYPVTPDVQLPLLSTNLFVLAWIAESLLLEAGLRPRDGDDRVKNAILARMNASGEPLDAHVQAYAYVQLQATWPDKPNYYRDKPAGD